MGAGMMNSSPITIIWRIRDLLSKQIGSISPSKPNSIELPMLAVSLAHNSMFLLLSGYGRARNDILLFAIECNTTPGILSLHNPAIASFVCLATPQKLSPQ
ncbi:hypothetical protein ACMFMG_000500 [Clarireedia jacksonii]